MKSRRTRRADSPETSSGFSKFFGSLLTQGDKTRLEYLDAAKGLGILLVILGHIYAWNPNINRKILVTWIYSFHMPLFFIVSGMLIKYKNYCNIKEFIFSRIKHILVPYIVFSLCNALVRILLYGYDESAFIRDVICTFILIGVDTWFLQALFWQKLCSL